MTKDQEDKLRRALIKFSGVFPDDMEIFMIYLEALRNDAIRGAIAHKEDGLALRFLGRYWAMDDLINYIKSCIEVKK